MDLRLLGIDLKVPSMESDPSQAVVIEVNNAPVLVQLFKMGYQDRAVESYARILDAAFGDERTDGER